MKADRPPAITLADFQTVQGDLIDFKFVYLYYILTRLSEKKPLILAIKGSLGTMDKECFIQLDWIGYLEECIFYVGNLSGWDMILEEPALSASKTQISTFKKLVIKQLRNMQRFLLIMWQSPRT